MAKALFVTGTATDVGKTYVSACLCKAWQDRGYRTAYFKPAMSGNPVDREGRVLPMDARYVKERAGLLQPLESMCPYVFQEAVSPHLAAERAQVTIEKKQVLEALGKLSDYDAMTVEGAGSVLCPLSLAQTPSLWFLDIIKETTMQALVVAQAGLGAIGSLGLTLSYLAGQGVSVAGVVMNGFDRQDFLHVDNVRVCQKEFGIQNLWTLGKGETLSFDLATLEALYKGEA